MAETSRRVPPHLGLDNKNERRMRQFAGERRRRVAVGARGKCVARLARETAHKRHRAKQNSQDDHLLSHFRASSAGTTSAMFIPPSSSVDRQLAHGNRRQASFGQAPNDPLSFPPPKDTHSSSSLQLHVSSTFVISDAVAATDTYASDAVLSTSDIVVGTILAFALAFGWSFLNGQSSSSNFISWRSQLDDDGANTSGESGTTIRPDAEERNGFDADCDNINRDISDPKVFNADDWKEMSRKENYVLYNTRVREGVGERKADRDVMTTKGDTKGEVTMASGVRSEKKWVLVALLVLFVPIFSVEFFFALSRQFMCGGDAMNQPEWAQILCSPYKGP